MECEIGHVGDGVLQSGEDEGGDGQGDHQGLGGLALEAEAGEHADAHQKIAQHAPEEEQIPGGGQLARDDQGQIGPQQLPAGAGAGQQQAEHQNAQEIAQVGQRPDTEGSGQADPAVVEGYAHDQDTAGEQLTTQQDNEGESGREGQGPQQLGQREIGVVEPGGAEAGEQGAHKDKCPRQGGPGQVAARRGAGEAELLHSGLRDLFHNGSCHGVASL